jgi:carbamoyl-phosphate synthase large subunit
MLLGSGPIVIGQGCEFDYSGAQACKALRAAGHRVVLVNSNPATIMTDPEMADATYVEPLTAEYAEKVIREERPDALLPTLGGQTALNVAVELSEGGVLEAHGVELIGAGLETIRMAEDRHRFTETVTELGLEVARSAECATVAEALEFADSFGLPVLVRPSYTLGGAGSGLARTRDDVARMAGDGITASPIGRVALDVSLLGWKEYELELMRDRADNCVVVCSIENVDATGVHTGDSVTVAPAQTLSDPEYQAMRDAAFAIMRAAGVDTGGANVQFAVEPATGRLAVIEMNPRVSRSSALASKATGFPIAKLAALLATGATLDELRNDVTVETMAAFEPTIDYVVTKVPRFAFEKFAGADTTLTSRMKSVGEVMAIGRTFAESAGKALRSLETDDVGLTGTPTRAGRHDLAGALATPHDRRLLDADAALDGGWSAAEVAAASGYDGWFVAGLAEAAAARTELAEAGELAAVSDAALRRAKQAGLSDAAVGAAIGCAEAEVRSQRRERGVTPVFKTVDTCAAEFVAQTPYHYSTYEEETEVAASTKPRVLILGSGPNRIGQGIEFDYCCVHAVMALSAAGYETVMVNCKPETVSTDYDTADRLYFEPLTLEDTLAVYEAEQAAAAAGGTHVAGVVVQLGGQTPLGLADELAANGVPILGTPPESIDLAEDRGRFAKVLDRLGIAQSDGAVAASQAQALDAAGRIGFPVLVRPSYVLGGRAMEIVYTEDGMRAWLEANAAEGAVLVDGFLEGAVEADVDAVYDGAELYLGGILEHIEEAGVHSGDSACVTPPHTLDAATQDALRQATEAIAAALGTQGLINIQFAVRGGQVYCLEANPRASRTVPFTSKATGVPLAKVAARVMAGGSLARLRGEGLVPQTPTKGTHVAVKEAVLPFNRFPGVDARLGPEMRSTGEVMGLGTDFGAAFAKSQTGAGGPGLPAKGTVFVSVADRDKPAVLPAIVRLAGLGFTVVATSGTAEALRAKGVEVEVVGKFSEGGPSVVERIESGAVDLVCNTPRGAGSRADGYEIRTASVAHAVPYVTTPAAMQAAVHGVEALQGETIGVESLQLAHRP